MITSGLAAIITDAEKFLQVRKAPSRKIHGRLTQCQKLSNIAEILNPPSMFITKLSILLQLAHLFIPNRSSKTGRFMQLFILVNFLWFLAAFFVSIFYCRPRAKIWKPALPGECLNFQVFILITGLFNAVSDITLLAMPIVVVWRLQMSMKRKLGISAVFAIGTV